MVVVPVKALVKSLAAAAEVPEPATAHLTVWAVVLALSSLTVKLKAVLPLLPSDRLTELALIDTTGMLGGAVMPKIWLPVLTPSVKLNSSTPVIKSIPLLTLLKVQL